MVSRLEALVLDLLVTGPTYGLDLVASSRRRLKRGSVYVTLGRMEQKGFVTSKSEPRPGEGPPRRLYELTPLGHRAREAVALLGRSPALGRSRG